MLREGYLEVLIKVYKNIINVLYNISARNAFWICLQNTSHQYSLNSNFCDFFVVVLIHKIESLIKAAGFLIIFCTGMIICRVFT